MVELQGLDEQNVDTSVTEAQSIEAPEMEAPVMEAPEMEAPAAEVEMDEIEMEEVAAEEVEMDEIEMEDPPGIDRVRARELYDTAEGAKSTDQGFEDWFGTLSDKKGRDAAWKGLVEQQAFSGSRDIFDSYLVGLDTTGIEIYHEYNADEVNISNKELEKRNKNDLTSAALQAQSDSEKADLEKQRRTTGTYAEFEQYRQESKKNGTAAINKIMVEGNERGDGIEIITPEELSEIKNPGYGKDMTDAADKAENSSLLGFIVKASAYVKAGVKVLTGTNPEVAMLEAKIKSDLVNKGAGQILKGTSESIILGDYFNRLSDRNKYLSKKIDAKFPDAEEKLKLIEEYHTANGGGQFTPEQMEELRSTGLLDWVMTYENDHDVDAMRKVANRYEELEPRKKGLGEKYPIWQAIQNMKLYSQLEYDNAYRSTSPWLRPVLNLVETVGEWAHNGVDIAVNFLPAVGASLGIDAAENALVGSALIDDFILIDPKASNSQREVFSRETEFRHNGSIYNITVDDYGNVTQVRDDKHYLIDFPGVEEEVSKAYMSSKHPIPPKGFNGDPYLSNLTKLASDFAWTVAGMRLASEGARKFGAKISDNLIIGLVTSIQYSGDMAKNNIRLGMPPATAARKGLLDALIEASSEMLFPGLEKSLGARMKLPASGVARISGAPISKWQATKHSVGMGIGNTSKELVEETGALAGTSVNDSYWAVNGWDNILDSDTAFERFEDEFLSTAVLTLGLMGPVTTYQGIQNMKYSRGDGLFNEYVFQAVSNVQHFLDVSESIKRAVGNASAARSKEGTLESDNKTADPVKLATMLNEEQDVIVNLNKEFKEIIDDKEISHVNKRAIIGNAHAIKKEEIIVSEMPDGIMKTRAEERLKNLKERNDLFIKFVFENKGKNKEKPGNHRPRTEEEPIEYDQRPFYTRDGKVEKDLTEVDRVTTQGGEDVIVHMDRTGNEFYEVPTADGTAIIDSEKYVEWEKLDREQSAAMESSDNVDAIRDIFFGKKREVIGDFTPEELIEKNEANSFKKGNIVTFENGDTAEVVSVTKKGRGISEVVLDTPIGKVTFKNAKQVRDAMGKLKKYTPKLSTAINSKGLDTTVTGNINRLNKIGRTDEVSTERKDNIVGEVDKQLAARGFGMVVQEAVELQDAGIIQGTGNIGNTPVILGSDGVYYGHTAEGWKPIENASVGNTITYGTKDTAVSTILNKKLRYNPDMDAILTNSVMSSRHFATGNPNIIDDINSGGAKVHANVVTEYIESLPLLQDTGDYKIYNDKGDKIVVSSDGIVLNEEQARNVLDSLDDATLAPEVEQVLEDAAAERSGKSVEEEVREMLGDDYPGPWTFDADNLDFSKLPKKQTNGKEINRMIKNFITAMAKVLPGVKVVVHTNKTWKRHDVAAYIPKDRAILINLDTINAKVFAHEVIHPILIALQHNDHAMYQQMEDDINDAFMNGKIPSLDAFSKQYSGKKDPVIRHEILTEFLARVVTGEITLTGNDVSALNKAIKSIVDFLNKLLGNAITFNIDDLSSSEDIVHMANLVRDILDGNEILNINERLNGKESTFDEFGEENSFSYLNKEGKAVMNDVMNMFHNQPSRFGTFRNFRAGVELLKTQIDPLTAFKTNYTTEAAYEKIVKDGIPKGVVEPRMTIEEYYSEGLKSLMDEELSMVAGVSARWVSQLPRARDMASKGKTNAEIYAATGWVNNWGKWQAGIAQKINVVDNFRDLMLNSVDTIISIGDVIKNIGSIDIFKAYPFLKNLRIILDQDLSNSYGQYVNTVNQSKNDIAFKIVDDLMPPPKTATVSERDWIRNTNFELVTKAMNGVPYAMTELRNRIGAGVVEIDGVEYNLNGVNDIATALTEIYLSENNITLGFIALDEDNQDLNTIMHELQHAIQHYEGWGGGISPDFIISSFMSPIEKSFDLENIKEADKFNKKLFNIVEDRFTSGKENEPFLLAVMSVIDGSVKELKFNNTDEAFEFIKEFKNVNDTFKNQIQKVINDQIEGLSRSVPSAKRYMNSPSFRFEGGVLPQNIKELANDIYLSTEAEAQARMIEDVQTTMNSQSETESGSYNPIQHMKRADMFPVFFPLGEVAKYDDVLKGLSAAASVRWNNFLNYRKEFKQTKEDIERVFDNASRPPMLLQAQQAAEWTDFTIESEESLSYDIPTNRSRSLRLDNNSLSDRWISALIDIDGSYNNIKTTDDKTKAQVIKEQAYVELSNIVDPWEDQDFDYPSKGPFVEKLTDGYLRGQRTLYILDSPRDIEIWMIESFDQAIESKSGRMYDSILNNIRKTQRNELSKYINNVLMLVSIQDRLDLAPFMLSLVKGIVNYDILHNEDGSFKINKRSSSYARDFEPFEYNAVMALYNNGPSGGNIVKDYVIEKSKIEHETQIPEDNIIINNEHGVWYKFSQGDHEHVSLLGTLSPWCTKNEATAQSYLSNGDLYIFVNNKGESKIQVNILNDGNISQIGGSIDGQQTSSEDTPRITELLKEINSNEYETYVNKRAYRAFHYNIDRSDENFEKGVKYAASKKEDISEFTAHNYEGVSKIYFDNIKKLPKGVNPRDVYIEGFNENGHIYIGDYDPSNSIILNEYQPSMPLSVTIVYGDVSFSPYDLNAIEEIHGKFTPMIDASDYHNLMGPLGTPVLKYPKLRYVSKIELVDDYTVIGDNIRYAGDIILDNGAVIILNNVDVINTISLYSNMFDNTDGEFISRDAASGLVIAPNLIEISDGGIAVDENVNLYAPSLDIYKDDNIFSRNDNQKLESIPRIQRAINDYIETATNIYDIKRSLDRTEAYITSNLMPESEYILNSYLLDGHYARSIQYNEYNNVLSKTARSINRQTKLDTDKEILRGASLMRTAYEYMLNDDMLDTITSINDHIFTIDSIFRYDRSPDTQNNNQKSYTQLLDSMLELYKQAINHYERQVDPESSISISRNVRLIRDSIKEFMVDIYNANIEISNPEIREDFNYHKFQNISNTFRSFFPHDADIVELLQKRIKDDFERLENLYEKKNQLTKLYSSAHVIQKTLHAAGGSYNIAAYAEAIEDIISRGNTFEEEELSSLSDDSRSDAVIAKIAEETNPDKQEALIEAASIAFGVSPEEIRERIKDLKGDAPIHRLVSKMLAAIDPLLNNYPGTNIHNISNSVIKQMRAKGYTEEEYPDQYFKDLVSSHYAQSRQSGYRPAVDGMSDKAKDKIREIAEKVNDEYDALQAYKDHRAAYRTRFKHELPYIYIKELSEGKDPFTIKTKVSKTAERKGISDQTREILERIEVEERSADEQHRLVESVWNEMANATGGTDLDVAKEVLANWRSVTDSATKLRILRKAAEIAQLYGDMGLWSDLTANVVRVASDLGRGLQSMVGTQGLHGDVLDALFNDMNEKEADLLNQELSGKPIREIMKDILKLINVIPSTKEGIRQSIRDFVASMEEGLSSAHAQKLFFNLSDLLTPAELALPLDLMQDALRAKLLSAAKSYHLRQDSRTAVGKKRGVDKILDAYVRKSTKQIARPDEIRKALAPFITGLNGVDWIPFVRDAIDNAGVLLKSTAATPAEKALASAYADNVKNQFMGNTSVNTNIDNISPDLEAAIVDALNDMRSATLLNANIAAQLMSRVPGLTFHKAMLIQQHMQDNFSVLLTPAEKKALRDKIVDLVGKPNTALGEGIFRKFAAGDFDEATMLREFALHLGVPVLTTEERAEYGLLMQDIMGARNPKDITNGYKALSLFVDELTARHGVDMKTQMAALLDRVIGHGYASMLSGVQTWQRAYISAYLEQLGKMFLDLGLSITSLDMDLPRIAFRALREYMQFGGLNAIERLVYNGDLFWRIVVKDEPLDYKFDRDGDPKTSASELKNEKLWGNWKLFFGALKDTMTGDFASASDMIEQMKHTRLPLGKLGVTKLGKATEIPLTVFDMLIYPILKALEYGFRLIRFVDGMFSGFIDYEIGVKEMQDQLLGGDSLTNIIAVRELQQKQDQAEIAAIVKAEGLTGREAVRRKRDLWLGTRDTKVFNSSMHILEVVSLATYTNGFLGVVALKIDRATMSNSNSVFTKLFKMAMMQVVPFIKVVTGGTRLMSKATPIWGVGADIIYTWANGKVSLRGKPSQVLEYNPDERKHVWRDQTKLEEQRWVSRTILGLTSMAIIFAQLFDLDDDEEYGVTRIVPKEDSNVRITGFGTGFFGSDLKADKGYKPTSLQLRKANGKWYTVLDYSIIPSLAPIGALFGNMYDRYALTADKFDKGYVVNRMNVYNGDKIETRYQADLFTLFTQQMYSLHHIAFETSVAKGIRNFMDFLAEFMDKPGTSSQIKTENEAARAEGKMSRIFGQVMSQYTKPSLYKQILGFYRADHGIPLEAMPNKGVTNNVIEKNMRDVVGLNLFANSLFGDARMMKDEFGNPIIPEQDFFVVGGTKKDYALPEDWKQRSYGEYLQRRLEMNPIYEKIYAHTDINSLSRYTPMSDVKGDFETIPTDIVDEISDVAGIMAGYAVMEKEFHDLLMSASPELFLNEMEKLKKDIGGPAKSIVLQKYFNAIDPTILNYDDPAPLHYKSIKAILSNIGTDLKIPKKVYGDTTKSKKKAEEEEEEIVSTKGIVMAPDGSFRLGKDVQAYLKEKHPVFYKFAVTDGRKIQDALPNVTDIDLIEWATWTDNAVEMRDKLLKRYYSQ